MTPAHPQILGIDVIDEISRRRYGFRMEDVAHAAKYVAAIVERDYLKVSGDGNARFQIRYYHRIAADGNGERIETDQFSMAVAKQSLRHDRLPRAGFFKSKTSQSGRAARKETLADWQQPIDVIDAPVAVSIARRKHLSQTHSQISGQHCLPYSVEFVVGMIVCKKAAKRGV